MSIISPVIDYIDGVSRRIYLKAGVRSYHPVDDICVEVQEMRATDADLRKYELFCKAQGGVFKGGTSYTSRYALMLNGTRIVPANDADHELTILGEQLDGIGGVGSDMIDKTPLSVTVDLVYAPPATVEAITIAVGSGVTAQDKLDIATQVWAAVSRTLTQEISGLTPAQANKLNAIPTNPLLTNDARLNYLDKKISEVTGSTPAEIWGYTTRTLTTSVSTDLTPVLNAISALNDITVAEIQAGLLDENDGQAILNAIVGAIGNTNVDEIALVAAIRADLERVGGKLGLIELAIPSNPLLADDARLDYLDSPVSAGGDPTAIWTHPTRSLTVPAGLTVAENARLMAIPVNPVLASDLRIANLDMAVSESKLDQNTVNHINSIPNNPLLVNDARIDAIPANVWGYGTREITQDFSLTTAQNTQLFSIPTNPVLSTDLRLDNLDIPVSESVLTTLQNDKLMGLPDNPLLSNDVRLDNLDAPMSGSTPTQIWGFTTRELTSIPDVLTPVQNDKLMGLPSAQENADTLLETPMPANPTLGSFGHFIKNKLLTLFKFNAYK